MQASVPKMAGFWHGIVPELSMGKVFLPLLCFCLGDLHLRNELRGYNCSKSSIYSDPMHAGMNTLNTVS